MRSLIVDRLKRLSAPVPAIPVDLFRILIGLLALGYFINLALYAREFLDPQGLVDHQLHEQTIFLSRFGVFSATAPLWQINGALALAIVCCIGTVLGVRIRPCALTAYVIAVSCFRRMFIFTYVDDTIMHLMLLWVVLLPCGETLSLRRLRLPDAQERERWLAAKVSGFVPRLVVFNACLIYLVAGLWKFTSPLWRQGLALFTILKLPAISLFPGYWREFMLLLLVPLSYLALVIEPSLPILLTRKPGSPLKWLGLISALALHLGIVATLKVPFANLAMSAVLVLFFRSELMRILGKRPAMREADKTSFPLRWPEKVSLVLVTGILMISTREIPVLDPLNEPGYAVLWSLGAFQDYRLFDWIDDKNFQAHFKIQNASAEVSPSDELFPDSVRGYLAQAYVLGLPWMPIPEEGRAAIRYSLLSRAAGRYCEKHPLAQVSLAVAIDRVTPESSSPTELSYNSLMDFRCQAKNSDAVSISYIAPLVPLSL